MAMSLKVHLKKNIAFENYLHPHCHMCTINIYIQLRIEGHFGFRTFWTKFCNIIRYGMNLNFETIVQFFRKIIQLITVVIMKSTNEYHRKFISKSGRNMDLYPAMNVHFSPDPLAICCIDRWSFVLLRDSIFGGAGCWFSIWDHISTSHPWDIVWSELKSYFSIFFSNKQSNWPCLGNAWDTCCEIKSHRGGRMYCALSLNDTTETRLHV